MPELDEHDRTLLAGALILFMMEAPAHHRFAAAAQAHRVAVKLGIVRELLDLSAGAVREARAMAVERN